MTTSVAVLTKSASVGVAIAMAVAVWLSIDPANISLSTAAIHSFKRIAANPSRTDSSFVSIVSAGSSTIDGLNISATHPRLFWNADRLAKAQSWWGRHSYTPNVPNLSPFDPYDTLLACQMSNNQAWCDAQINWAVNLSEASCYQSVGCDSMRVYGEAVMLTYDWLYARMTAAQRTTIINNWNTWQNYLDTSNSWGNTGMPSSNYFAGAFRTDFSMGVATLGDNAQATNFLNYALNKRWAAVVNFVSLTGTGTLAGKGLRDAQTGRLTIRTVLPVLFRGAAGNFRADGKGFRAGNYGVQGGSTADDLQDDADTNGIARHLRRLDVER